MYGVRAGFEIGGNRGLLVAAEGGRDQNLCSKCHSVQCAVCSVKVAVLKLHLKLWGPFNHC